MSGADPESVKRGERLKKFRESLKMSQRDFAKAVGLTQPMLSSVESGFKSLRSNNLKLITDSYHLNLHWYFTGKGSMVIEGYSFDVDAGQYLVNIPARGGGLIDWSQEFIAEHTTTVSIPSAPRNAWVFRVEGDSMLPTLGEGDMVVTERIELEDVRPNRIHVVVTKEGMYVKRVVVHKEIVLLESDNEIEELIRVPLADVFAFYYAKMRITRNLSSPRPHDARLSHIERFLKKHFKDEFKLEEEA